MDRSPDATPSPETAAADLRLVAEVLAGEPTARSRLIDRLASLPAMVRAKRHRLRLPMDPPAIDDVVQNTLLHLWRKLATYDGRVPLPAWAMGFATMELLKVRARHHRQREQSTDLRELPDERGADPTDGLEALARLLERLPPDAANLLRARHLEGCSFAELAERSGEPIAAVKTRYYRSLQELRRRLSRTEDSDDER